MNSFFEEILAAQTSGQYCVLCTVVKVQGSTPRKPGAKMLVYPDGKISGTVGGGDLELKVIENAQLVLQSGQARLVRHDLLHQHNMCCGGSMEIFLEPLQPVERLYIFGAGHTGLALATGAAGIAFDVVLIDDRKVWLDRVTDPRIAKMNLHHEQALPLLPFNERTYIVILTYRHSIDREILAHCIRKPHAYLGMIGSQRKIALTRKMFLEGGMATEAQLDKADMPIGLNIGAQTPEEIAVSILAKMIAVRHEQSLPAKKLPAPSWQQINKVLKS
jgi:xanthine dehydrogenase accessory factor